MSLTDPFISYDPREVGLDAAKGAVRYMVDPDHDNRKRAFVKFTELAASSGDPQGWLEVVPQQFTVMTAFQGFLDYDPVVTGLAGTVGDVWIGPGLGQVCLYEKAGTEDTEWARISEYSGGVPAVADDPALFLSAQGWTAIAPFTSTEDGLVPASGGGTDNFLRADGTWAEPPDPWTYVKLGSDFSTTSGSSVNVTGLAFTPAAGLTYAVEAFFLCRTATATVGPQPGATWPTGTTDGAGHVEMTSSATAVIEANQPAGTALVASSTGVPNTTASWPGQLKATFVTGGSPSGDLQITLRSETAGTSVTMKAGSWLRYRTI